jgi:hypothetical protein
MFAAEHIQSLVIYTESFLGQFIGSYTLRLYGIFFCPLPQIVEKRRLDLTIDGAMRPLLTIIEM